MTLLGPLMHFQKKSMLKSPSQPMMLVQMGVGLISKQGLWRSVHDSFSLFDLESDLFGGSTTHEVHNERTLLGRKQQLIDPWDPGVWASKDEESVWEEFSFV